MSAIIKVENLTKSFSDIKAVQNLSFTVEQGSVYGFIGQNGAGKSTTIRMLLTLVSPDVGEIEIFGLSLSKNRNTILRKIGALIERPDLYNYLTAFENLKLFAALSGVKINKNYLMNQLQQVGLDTRADSKVKTFSQGMKQRLGIAIALVHNPELIILDEPMNGLDPQGIADIRQLILNLSRQQGKTIFVSSHLLSEVEQIADSLLIIHKGEKVIEGTVQDLLNPEESMVEVETKMQDELIKGLTDSQWVSRLYKREDGKLIFRMKKNEMPAFISALGNLQLQVFSVRRKNSLEDYFLSLTTQ
ncbi:MAG: ATP-binding cassette domain-containing protein [Chitinophagaceae bacterium]|nr:MAG: ATP-binding cassette domain-containing protein [Chitinophagaceae bacterium]